MKKFLKVTIALSAIAAAAVGVLYLDDYDDDLDNDLFEDEDDEDADRDYVTLHSEAKDSSEDEKKSSIDTTTVEKVDTQVATEEPEKQLSEEEPQPDELTPDETPTAVDKAKELAKDATAEELEAHISGFSGYRQDA